MSSSLPTVLITGASSGIGAVYADRFAKRGHDLVLVARNRERMEALGERLRAEHGVRIDVIGADLTQPAALGEVAARVHDDTRIGVLINNAGVATAGTFAEQDTQALDNLLELNIAAPTRLAHAAAQRFAREGGGAIVNIASVVGLAPELGMTVYGASKAYVLYLSQGLHLELGPRGVYVQAVLPAATRTEIWERSGFDISKVEGVMEVGELVDAALVGYDRRETVTIPPLPDAAQWSAFDAARQAMLPNFRQSHAAERYSSGQ